MQSDIPYTIFRPSGYFVDFAEYFAPKIRNTGSFTVIGNGLTRLQPLDPADLAEAFIQSLDNKKAVNKLFKIGGPEVFTLVEIINLVSKVVDRKVTIRKVPFWIMNALFSVIATLTGKRGSKDFLYRMSRDSVCSAQEMKAVKDAFEIEFNRLEPWLREKVINL
jgi:NADH dehydrogenase